MNGRDRAWIWFSMLEAEREQRRLLALSPAAEEAANAFFADLETMATRIGAMPRPGEAALAHNLIALTQTEEYAQIEQLRTGVDMSMAVTVAFLLTVDPAAAGALLDHYAEALGY